MFTFSIFTILYFLPTFIAAHRGHQITGIFLLNLLFGWTGIVWLALLLWAMLSAPRYVLVAPYPAAQYYWRRY
jgi:hypothetical protein